MTSPGHQRAPPPPTAAHSPVDPNTGSIDDLAPGLPPAPASPPTPVSQKVPRPPSPPFIDLHKYLAQSSHRPAKRTLKARIPRSSTPEPAVATGSAGIAVAGDTLFSEASEKPDEYPSEAESTDADSSMGEALVEDEHAIAQPVSDAAFSVIVSRHTQYGGLQSISLPIYPSAAKTLHGQMYIRLQDVMDSIMWAEWSIPEPLSASDHKAVGIYLTTTSVSHHHDRFVGWGQVDPADREAFVVQAPNSLWNQQSSLSVWLPIRPITNPAAYQLALGFKICSRQWLDRQQVPDGHAEIAFLDSEKTDRAWFALPSPDADGGGASVPLESVAKSEWHATVYVIDGRSEQVHRMWVRLTSEWRLKHGLCYVNGSLILQAVELVATPPEETQRLAVFLAGVGGEKLYLGYIQDKAGYLPQHAWRVTVPVPMFRGHPQVICFVAMGPTEALMKYDNGLANWAHFLRRKEKPPAWTIPPQLLASVSCDDLIKCKKDLPQLLDPSYDPTLIHEVVICWINHDRVHRYSMPALPGHWSTIDGTYYISMHHLIDWAACSEQFKLPSPPNDQGVHLAALNVGKTTVEWVFVGVGKPGKGGVLHFEPPAQFRPGATVWIPLHCEGEFFQYFSCRSQLLSEMEELQPRENYRSDKRSHIERRYYMKPGYEPISDPPNEMAESRAPINCTVVTQRGKITAVFRSWTIRSGVTYICGMKTLTRLLEIPEIESQNCPLGVSLETSESTLFLGLLYPAQHRVVGPTAVSQTPSDQAVFLGIPITMEEAGRGRVHLRVWTCAYERIKGEEILGVKDSHFERLYPDKDSAQGHWFIPKSYLPPPPPINKQIAAHGSGAPSQTSGTQPQCNRGMAVPKGICEARQPPDISAQSVAEAYGGRSAVDLINKLGKRRGQSTGGEPDAEKGYKKPRLTGEDRAAKVLEALRECRYDERPELKPIWERLQRKAMPLKQTLALGQAMWDALKHTAIGQLPAADLIDEEYHNTRINMDDWMKYFMAGRSWLTDMKFIGRHMQDRSVENILRRLRIEHYLNPDKGGLGVAEVRSHLDKLLGSLGDD